jgi:hypothetical protein
MSEVKRYTESCMEGGGVAESKDGELVDYSAYAAAQSELATWKLKAAEASEREAALREELAIKVEAYQGAHMMCTDLKASLTAAEQRNAELVELLQSINDPQSIGEAFANAFKVRKFLGELVFAEDTSPTESGASE